MASDPSFIAGVGLLSSLSAMFLGLSVAVVVLSLLRLGDGKGAGRISLIIVLCSFAIAAGAWVFVLAVRNGLGVPDLKWYALVGLALGLFGGLLPRLTGIPLLTLAVLAVFLGISEVSSWHPWQDELRVLELKIYAADETSSLCGLSLPDRNAVPVLQNLRLAPGDLVLHVDVLILEGPLAFFCGSRHYRLASLEADPGSRKVGEVSNRDAKGLAEGFPAVHVFPFRKGILEGDGTGSPLMAFLGLSRRILRSDPLPAEDLAQGNYVLRSDGGLASLIR